MPETKTIPTIGRVVWYKDTELSDQMMAADVSYVHSETSVNLCVKNHNGAPFNQTSVPFFHGDAADCPEHSCCWMPYQQKKAAAEASS